MVKYATTLRLETTEAIGIDDSPKLTGRSAIAAAGVDQAVKAGAHVHVAGRHGVGGRDHGRADAKGR
ncbi:hypothetical protein ACIQFZ_21635 [Streptomyces sp. NPDC093064]|uniref:hypothetical protein n=1 Tax=unclassified Streptomyces TaxID=2593676 RepID=UPI0034307657